MILVQTDHVVDLDLVVSLAFLEKLAQLVTLAQQDPKGYLALVVYQARMEKLAQ